jgi:hypothetical protein
MKKTLLSLVAILAFAGIANAQVPARTGWWKFDDISDLWKAEVGEALIATGNITSVDGPSVGNLAVEVPVGSYFAMNHGIAPNGGGTLVNEYSIMWDFAIPATETWYSFLETAATTSDDADLFIAASANSGISRVPNSIGTGSLLYTANTVSADTWYRMLLTIKNGEFADLYVNGELWPVSSELQGYLVQDVDGRYGLAPTIFIFQDGDGDDGTLKCSEISMWDVALTAEQALALGDVNTVQLGIKGNKTANTSDLMPNYPNPVTHNTKFPYQVQKSGNVTFRVIDQTGKVIDVINAGTKSAGQYNLDYNSDKLTNGIYSVQMTTNNRTSMRKMVVIR